MDYCDMNHALTEAWDKFFEVLEESGIDTSKVAESMDSKDCFNDVRDCVLTGTTFTEED